MEEYYQSARCANTEGSWNRSDRTADLGSIIYNQQRWVQ